MPVDSGVPGPSEDPAWEEASRAELQSLREQIAELDERLVRTIGERRTLVLAVGQLKAALGLPVLDPAQEARVVRNAANRARELGVDEEMTRDVMWRIIAFARNAQEAGQTVPEENGSDV
jgi:chorismate mutase/prephenate dehydratase